MGDNVCTRGIGVTASLWCESGSASHKGDPGSRLINLPHIQSLVLIQALVKLVWCVAFGKDALPCLIKPHHVWVCHLTKDAIDSVNGFGAPEDKTEV